MNQMMFIKEKSDPEINSMLLMGQLVAPMILGMSPIAVRCERWHAAAMKRLADHFGYLLEFVCEHPCHCGSHPEPWDHDEGEVMMTKAAS